jgi:hypothetical protein
MLNNNNLDMISILSTLMYKVTHNEDYINELEYLNKHLDSPGISYLINNFASPMV